MRKGVGGQRGTRAPPPPAGLDCAVQEARGGVPAAAAAFDEERSDADACQGGLHVSPNRLGVV